MKQRISIGLSVVVCIVILGVLMLLGYYGKYPNMLKKQPIEDYGQLEVYIQLSSDVEQVNIWKSESDCYYFFLPSCATKSHVSFGNLQAEDRIAIGQTVYDRNDNIIEGIEYDVVYDMQLTIHDEVLPKQKVVFQCSENLPTVFLNTETGTIDQIHAVKGIKEAAEVTILQEDGSLEFAGNIEYVKTRGNSTFYEVEKKSYQIKLHGKKDLFEMGSAKKWILLANAKDESFIRTSLILDFCSTYTDVENVEGVFVDLYLNGDYTGNYYLCEKVEVGENRLDITDLEAENEKINSEDVLKNGAQYISEDGNIRAVIGMKNPQDITGGYLLEKIIDEEYDLARSAFISSNGYRYRVVSPENASVEQVEYIREQVNALEIAISQADGIHPETGKHYSEYMDVESWVSKFLMEEFFNNPDAPAASTYMYKDSDEVDGKLYFGPAWDYDRAIGSYVVGNFSIDAPQQIGYRGLYASQLLSFNEVEELVLAEYQEKYLPYLDRKAEYQIFTLQEYIEASAKMDKVRWPKAKGYYETWEAAGEYMINFLEERAAYLNDVWLDGEQYHTVQFLDYYGNVYNQYEIKHGEYLTEVPSIATYVAVFQGWQNAATGRKLDLRLPILEDVTYQSTWIPVEYLLQNGLAAAEMDIADVDLEVLESLLEMAKQLQEAGDE